MLKQAFEEDTEVCHKKFIPFHLRTKLIFISGITGSYFKHIEDICFNTSRPIRLTTDVTSKRIEWNGLKTGRSISYFLIMIMQ